MRCYYHQDREAVGSCKSCGKGLCPDCAVDLAKGLACRGHCEEDARALIQLIDHNNKMQPTASRLIQAGGSARMAGSLFFLASGAVFLIYGLTSEREMTFVTILGVCFLAYGLFVLLWSRRLAARTQKTET
jgi:hypothetical protein